MCPTIVKVNNGFAFEHRLVCLNVLATLIDRPKSFFVFGERNRQFRRRHGSEPLMTFEDCRAIASYHLE